MPSCRLCSRTFPSRVWLDGKQHIVSKRKYCLACSPFGAHNTRVLERGTPQKLKTCPTCGRTSASSRLNTCSGCYARRRARVRDRLHAIVGEQCWICGYSGASRRSVLDFHHVRREDKSFNLNMAAANERGWSEVWLELQKCALLCCRCHREVEAGILESVVKADFGAQQNAIRRI